MSEKDISAESNVVPGIGVLEQQNTHERDNRIQFESEHHKYFIDGVQASVSVSEVIGEFFPKFNSEFWSKKKAKQRGVSAETVLKEWKDKGDQAANLGTYMHEQIELFYNQQEHDATSIEFKYFLDFTKKFPQMKPFRTEWRIFDKSLMLAGTVDMVYLNPKTGKYFIFDWKRSEKVVDAHGTPMIPSFQFASGALSHLSDNNYHKYCLQQNMYKHLLEKHYGIEVSSTNLLVLHPNRHSYQIVPIPTMDNEVAEIMESLKK